jgi:OPA family glycerol-3-phosphate transporter-like MFS transporter/OPA family sugar phosphate sensor protein UhpC-like MFS transporter
MTHWFSPREFATKMGIWNTSHSLGAAAVFVLCSGLILIGWRWCFYVPGTIAVLGAIGLAIFLRDTPESLGFPPVEGTADHKHDSEHLWSALRRLVFSNPYIWLLSFANFFVYIVRYGIVDWAPTFLKEARGIDVTHGGLVVAAYEIAGLVGILYGGWVTDRVFGSRGARACFFFMIGCTVSLVLFWKLPNQTWVSSTILLCFAGFFIYGPQSLIGTAAANLGTKRAAAAAVGVTGFFGYLSTAVSGYGIGALVDRMSAHPDALVFDRFSSTLLSGNGIAGIAGDIFARKTTRLIYGREGWEAGFMMFVVCSMLGVLFLAMCWPAKAHGYDVPIAELEELD